MEKKPFVSIIIPVYNNEAGLVKALQCIKAQSYPKERFEIIVVDNGSDYSPRKIVNEYNAKFLLEGVYLQSPYSARNRGLEMAIGDVIVLLDTTCAPVSDWLEQGVLAIESGCDLVGGSVVFDVTEKSSLGDMYDSLVNIKMKESVLIRSVAKTTNLFIHKRVFEHIGRFPEGIRSGGDVRWTRKATSAGFKLCFSENAKVVMKTRGLRQLISKTYRVSKGMPAIWKEQGSFHSSLIKKGILFFLPPNPVQLIKAIDANKVNFMRKRIFELLLIGYLLRIVAGCGVWVGVYMIKRNDQ